MRIFGANNCGIRDVILLKVAFEHQWPSGFGVPKQLVKSPTSDHAHLAFLKNTVPFNIPLHRHALPNLRPYPNHLLCPRNHNRELRRRLERHARLQPALAAARKIPQWTDQYEPFSPSSNHVLIKVIELCPFALVTASLLLTLLTLVYTHRPAATTRERGANLTTAALINSVYTVAGLAAIFYPGAAGMDPEFGEGFPQGWVFGGLLAVNWVGWWVATAALGGGAVGEGVGRKRQ
jgi:hypothetical protein